MLTLPLVSVGLASDAVLIPSIKEAEKRNMFHAECPVVANAQCPNELQNDSIAESASMKHRKRPREVAHRTCENTERSSHQMRLYALSGEWMCCGGACWRDVGIRGVGTLSCLR